MPEDLEKLKIALRALAAVTDFRQPEGADIQALRSYLPLFKRRPPDDLACEVIRRCLKRGAKYPTSMAEKV